MDKVGAVVLAAGQGKRMHSDIPKVLHRIAGAPLVRHVLDAVEEAGIKEIIAVSYTHLVGCSCSINVRQRPHSFWFVS